MMVKASLKKFMMMVKGNDKFEEPFFYNNEDIFEKWSLDGKDMFKNDCDDEDIRHEDWWYSQFLGI